MPGEDVAVETVVGGGDLAVGEPGCGGVGSAGGEGGGRGGVGEGGGCVPVEVGGLLEPEGGGGGEGGGLDFVLEVGHGGGVVSGWVVVRWVGAWDGRGARWR